MKWTLQDRGFLPNQDPEVQLNDADLKNVERLGRDLPQLVYDKTFRDASADYLKKPLDWDTLLPTMADPQVERLFMLFSYFTSAYVHAPGMTAVNHIPNYLAGPLTRCAANLERPPILSYASYCLHNWRRRDPAGPVALGNLELLQNFSLAHDGKKDEDWFILVHVDIEARAGAALTALSEVASYRDPEALVCLLTSTAASLTAMNKTMNRMPEGCSAEVYFRKVRPYIFGFTDMIYEGCFNNQPQSYRGETGAQSSIVPSLLVALGIRHKDSLLTQHLEDMRNYMPRPHCEFIQGLVSVRDDVVNAPTGHKKRLHGLYNECVEQLLAFRSRHFEYAVNYIEKKVANPIATGGTPYIPWLHQMIEETKGFILP